MAGNTDLQAYRRRAGQVLARQVVATCEVEVESGVIVVGPGTWIVYDGSMARAVLTDEQFHEQYEPVGQVRRA